MNQYIFQMVIGKNTCLENKFNIKMLRQFALAFFALKELIVRKNMDNL
jgi:hypothetical protein